MYQIPVSFSSSIATLHCETQRPVTKKFECHANGILQDYVKEYNLVVKKVNLHQQLCRKNVKKLFNKKKSKDCVIK